MIFNMKCNNCNGEYEYEAANLITFCPLCRYKNTAETAPC